MVAAPRIELIDVAKSFGAFRVIDGVSLVVQPGEVFGVIGESGAGKSTLIRLMNGLEPATSGRVLIDGEDLTAMPPRELIAARRKIGMIFQHFNLLSSHTAARNVALPLELAGRLDRAAIRKRVADLLDRIGLAGSAAKYPAQLSGGQKQRVGIARALASDPKVLLCDEPTSALDPDTRLQVLDLLAGLNRELGLTIVLVTHDMDTVRRVCDRVAVLHQGRIVEAGEVIDIFLHAEHQASRRLLGLDGTLPERAPGAGLFRLTWRGAVSTEPFLSAAVREAGVDIRVRSARVDEIKGEPFGQLLLSLEGGRTDVAVAQWRARGIHVRDLGQ